MSNVWQVQDAEARFSELLATSLAEGPQIVIKRGVETAVLVPIEHWCRHAKNSVDERHHISIRLVYLLDTNVVSELRLPIPHPSILNWIRDLSAEKRYLSAVTIGHRLTVVTRNVRDFEQFGVRIINPFEDRNRET